MSEGARIREWLKKLMAEAGVTAAELARVSGVHKSTIFRALSEDYEYVPSARTIARLAESVQLARDLPLMMEPYTVSPLHTPYELSPTTWIEDSEPHQDYAGTSQIVPHPSIPASAQWAGRMRGGSMSPVFEDGDYLHVANYGALKLDPREGDQVILRRHREATGGLQLSVRTVRERRDADCVLSFGSSERRWSQVVTVPVQGSVVDGVTHEIIGLVIGHYRERRIW